MQAPQFLHACVHQWHGGPSVGTPIVSDGERIPRIHSNALDRFKDYRRNIFYAFLGNGKFRGKVASS